MYNKGIAMTESGQEKIDWVERAQITALFIGFTGAIYSWWYAITC